MPVRASGEIQSLRKRLGLTQEEMAEMLGCSTRSLSTYEKSGDVPLWLRARLREANTLIAEIAPLLTQSELKDWMHAQLPAMNGRTPVRVIAEGDSISLFLLIRDAAMGGHS